MKTIKIRFDGEDWYEQAVKYQKEHPDYLLFQADLQPSYATIVYKIREIKPKKVDPEAEKRKWE